MIRHDGSEGELCHILPPDTGPAHGGLIALASLMPVREISF